MTARRCQLACVWRGPLHQGAEAVATGLLALRLHPSPLSPDPQQVTQAPPAGQRPAWRENLSRMPSHLAHQTSLRHAGSLSELCNEHGRLHTFAPSRHRRQERSGPPGSASERRMACAVMEELAKPRSQASNFVSARGELLLLHGQRGSSREGSSAPLV